MKKSLSAATLILALAGCASSPASGSTERNNRDVLTAEELQARRAVGRTAYELIANLRPEYLRSRGAVSLRDPTPVTATVYVDGIRFGSLESLKLINADHVTGARFINASDATTRFGTGNPGGAILVTTR